MRRLWAPQIDDEQVPAEEPGLQRFGNVVVQCVDKIALASYLAQYTESPIETILGVEIMLSFDSSGHKLIFSPQEAMDKIGGGEWIFVPQYKWRRYRIDWAICEGQKPKAFIECDGKDFHSSLEEQARDTKRDREIEAAGIIPMRFTGRDIHGSTVWCCEQVKYRIFPGWRRRT